MSNPNDTIHYELALSLVPKIGPSIFRGILTYAGDAKNFLKLPKGKAEKIPRISRQIIAIRNDFESKLNIAAQMINDCQKKTFKLLLFQVKHFLKG